MHKVMIGGYHDSITPLIVERIRELGMEVEDYSYDEKGSENLELGIFLDKYITGSQISNSKRKKLLSRGNRIRRVAVNMSSRYKGWIEDITGRVINYPYVIMWEKENISYET